jgi:murein DD-endopeptidase MepM/ murein hydrolase activator NlpD
MPKQAVFRILLAILLVYTIKVAIFSSEESTPSLPAKLLKPIPVTPPVDTLYPEMEVSGFQKAQTLGTLFQNSGLKRSEIAETERILKSIYPGAIFEGQEYILHRNGDSTLKTFILYSKDRGTRYKIYRENKGLTASVCVVPLDKKVLTLSGTLNTSLYEAMEKAGERPELIFKLIDVFSWDINWFMDPKEVDSFRIVYEKYYYGDRFIRYGDMLAAYYVNSGRVFSAYAFAPDSGARGYFNAEGVSLQKTFLKAPLTYRRISSGYSLSRLHPILNERRPHLGVDYAAPTGTPVKAAGDGRIGYAKTSNGYGKCIRVDHGNGYSTYYGHLSAFAGCALRQGKVSQGEVIGFVGMTGLATGPHLDYRISRNGKFINPLTLKSDPMKRVPEARMGEFASVKSKWDALLGATANTQYAASGRNNHAN